MNCSSCGEKHFPEGLFYTTKEDIIIKFQKRIGFFPVKFSTGFKLYFYMCLKCGYVSIKLIHNEYGRAGSLTFKMPEKVLQMLAQLAFDLLKGKAEG